VTEIGLGQSSCGLEDVWPGEWAAVWKLLAGVAGRDGWSVWVLLRRWTTVGGRSQCWHKSTQATSWAARADSAEAAELPPWVWSSQ